MKRAIQTIPKMGRSIIDHDSRNYDWPARGNLFAPDAVFREKVWRRGQAYDQYQTSSCVGQTGKGMLNTAPWSSFVKYDIRSRYDAIQDYSGAQDFDEWSGREPEYFGTSARGLCRFYIATRRIKEFRWNFSLEDTLLTLSHWGPVGIGVMWTWDMFYPDERGLINDTGGDGGGHEVELFGIHPALEEVEGMNSWGPEWGDRGRFRMKFETLERRLADYGDSFTLVTL